MQTSMSRPHATVREFLEYLEKNLTEEHLRFGWEWSQAMLAGWDDTEFEALYSEYVRSTQIELTREDDATAAKGRPLERLSRYFLNRGGVVYDIEEISAPGRWQVDGQGPLNVTAIRCTWGKNISERLGFQLYLESKNHVDPATGDEFSVHYRRMMDHDCRVGVFVSTSGFKIGRGLGIADSIRDNYLMGIFHLLLSFPVLSEVAVGGKPPLAILRTVLCFAANDRYAHDAEVQRMYSVDYCHEVARDEFRRLFP